MNKKLQYILLTVLSALISQISFAQTKYVRLVSSGTGDGSSWANASNDIQLMINQSSSGTQIWIASGTYRPVRRMDNLTTISIGNRQNAFVMKNGVHVYGGFTGVETSVSQRNLKNPANATILSADLNNNDGTNFTNMTENAYHVLVFSGSATNTVLDGVTITSAYYKEGTDPYDMPTVNGNIVHNHYGGALYIVNSSPIIRNVTFTKNLLHLGSGMYTDGSSSNPKIVNCIFHGNRGYFGAAVLNFQSSPEFYNTLMYNNEVLTNTALSSALQGGDGGAVYNWSANPIYVNCTVVKNTASKRGGGFFNQGGNVITRNCIIFGNTQGNTPVSATWEHQVFRNGGNVSIDNTIFQDWTGGGTNLNATGVTLASLFTNHTGHDYHLKSTAVTVNAGNNSYISAYSSDLDGRIRVVGARVDLGAFEFSKLKEWDKGAGTNNWSDANNWLPDGVPVSGDSIILNHKYVSGNYTVALPNSTVSVGSLKISPSNDNDSIFFNIPATNNVNNNLQLTATGFNALSIGNRGRLNNYHSSNNNISIKIDDIENYGMLLDEGAYYMHASVSPDIAVLLNLEARPNSTFEYKRASNYIFVFPLVSSVTTLRFYNLIFSGAGSAYNVTLAKNWDLYVEGNLTVRDNAAVGLVKGGEDQDDRKIYIRGDINIVNTTASGWVGMVSGSNFPLTFGWDVVFDGNVIQNINGNVEFFSKVDINNSHGVNVNNIFRVKRVEAMAGLMADTETQLIFSNGIINTIGSGTVEVEYDTEDAVTGHNENKYVNGILKRYVSANKSYDFPIGKNGNYQLATVRFGTLSATNTLTAEYRNTNTRVVLPSRLLDGGIEFDEVLNAGYWRLTPNIPISGNYSVTLHEKAYTNQELYHRVVKRSNELADWSFEGTHVSNSESGGVITAERSGLTGFSDFAIARNWVNPLPVELVKFEAVLDDKNIVQLNWQTASELNNDYFSIERSLNGLDWISVVTIKGAGNSSIPLFYEAKDDISGITATVIYYRLKQVDFDGKSEYSQIVATDLPQSQSSLKVYPNPVKNTLFIQTERASIIHEISLINASGQIVYSAFVRDNFHTINVNDFPEGIYFLKVGDSISKLIIHQ